MYDPRVYDICVRVGGTVLRQQCDDVEESIHLQYIAVVDFEFGLGKKRENFSRWKKMEAGQGTRTGGQSRREESFKSNQARRPCMIDHPPLSQSVPSFRSPEIKECRRSPRFVRDFCVLFTSFTFSFEFVTYDSCNPNPFSTLNKLYVGVVID